jgi:signal transduction histidine kinase
MARILLLGSPDETRADARRAIRQLSDHDLIEVCDGAAALARIARDHRGPLDLVLLDVDLPGVDGFDLCRRIRADERTEHLPVVFLTSQAQVELRLRALELGVTDVLVRPVDGLELLARLGSVLRSKALADEVRRHNTELASKVVERTRQLEELASELRIERDALRETFDVFDEALLLFDAAGQLQIENSAGRKLLEGPDGRSPDQEQVAERLAELAREAIARNARQDANLVHGSSQLEARAYPAAGRRALLYVRDVTAARNEELHRLQSEKLASIGMLAAGVAHEINNPASFVLANMEALAGLLRSLEEKLKADPQSARRLAVKDLAFEAMTIVQESKEGMARINRIVRDLHSFSRVDEDGAAVTDVNAAVESALTMLRNELRYRTAVDRDLRAGKPVRGNACPPRAGISQPHPQRRPRAPEGNLKRNRLTVRSFDEGREVVVEVEDNGEGIDAEVMPRIFESFFTTKPPGLGTGLGLPISRGIVRSLGGDLAAESTPGHGALFRVRLPAFEGPMPERPRPAPGAPRRRRRIVAVDDEALLLKAYRRMLIDHHDLEAKLGARAAMRHFEEDRAYEVVLCDLQMPEMSGAELYAAVKERWPSLAERFIFITGGAFSPEAAASSTAAASPASTSPSTSTSSSSSSRAVSPPPAADRRRTLVVAALVRREGRYCCLSAVPISRCRSAGSSPAAR